MKFDEFAKAAKDQQLMEDELEAEYATLSIDTCKVKPIEQVVQEIIDGTAESSLTDDDDDDEGELEQDLNEALELLGECQHHLLAFLQDNQFKSILQTEEVKALTADVGIFLDQWTWDDDDAESVRDKLSGLDGVIDI